MRPIYFHQKRPLLPFECHVIPNGQNHDCEISITRYLCTDQLWKKVISLANINVTANINVQNIRFIHLLMATYKDLHIENSKNYKR